MSLRPLFLRSFGLTLCLTAATAPPAPCQAPGPRVAAVSPAPSVVPRYGEFEVTFQVVTRAANLQLPYDPVEPAYAAHLSPDEDAARGVSVDGLFLPPGRTDWAKAEVQPAFYYEGYDQNLDPTGEKDWHLRFAPNVAGRWKVRLRARDADGTYTTPAQTFGCAPSASHGFVRVSPTDSRYFEYSDGTPFLPAGANDVSGGLAPVEKMIADGAVGLWRVWIAGNGGMEVVGGGGNVPTFHGVSYNPENDLPAGGRGYTDGQGGGTRFALPVKTQFQIDTDALRPGRAYTLITHIKLTRPTDPGPSLVLWPIAPGLPLRDTGGWQTAVLHVPASHGAEHNCNLGCNSTGPQFTPCLMDGWRITDDATGEAVVDGTGMDWVTRYDQRNSTRLDRLFDAALNGAAPQFYKLCCFQHEDVEWGQIAADAAGAGRADANAAGGADFVGDVAAQRFQGYFARYVMARWGWSPAFFGAEHLNEGDPNSGVYFAGAQSFAAHLHALTADHRPLASTSGWFGGRPGGYNWRFYEGALRGAQGQNLSPDIDYADVHDYVYAGQYAYNTSMRDFPADGASVVPTGGPTGGGYLRLTTGGSPPAPIFRLRGRGTWTIKFYGRSEPGAAYDAPNWFTHSAESVINNCVHTPITQTPPRPVPGWSAYSQTFILPDTKGDTQWTFHRGLLTAGAEDIADVRVSDPQGRLWTRYRFDEPNQVRDLAAYTEYLPLEFESYGGQPSIGKPLVIGETQPVGQNGGHAPYDRADGNWADPGGDSARQAAWGGIGAGAGVFQWWTDDAGFVGATDGWRFYAAVQRFMAGIPVSNGRYRNADPAVSRPGLIALGQQDARAGRAYLYVYNRQAPWEALAQHAPIQAVTGSVTLSGLPTQFTHYMVARYDCATGLRVSVEERAASHGVLTIGIQGLTRDTALKISPLGHAPARRAP